MKTQRMILPLMLLLLSFPSLAGTVVTGRVRDGQGKPVEAVMVKLFQADSLAAYTTTSAEGAYTISCDGTGSRITLVFEHLSFQRLSQTLPNRSQTFDATLSPRNLALKEVTVHAPAIVLQGDTLSYRLSAFASPGDVTLKEVLRKIPGIDVAQSGKIKYLGKAISHFYIEGLDLLGGKYNIATNNLPASYVNSVQVLNHHQDVRMDKEVFSDRVALNVKLSPKAKLRPVCTYRASTGYGDEWLYQLSGAGMLFKPDFQSILTLKAGNIREFEQEEHTDFSAQEPAGTVARDILGTLGTSSPPLDRERFIRPDDRSLSLNFLSKPGKEATLRTNIDYGYSHTAYGFDARRSYYREGADVLITQSQLPSARTHTPSARITYKVNGETRYLSEAFAASASLQTAGLPTRNGSTAIGQTQNLKEYTLRNDFDLRWKRGKTRWALSSLLLYAAAPSGQVSADGLSTGHFTQTARNYRLLTRQTLTGSYSTGRSRLSLPLTFQASADRIYTDLLLADTRAANRIKGTDCQFVLAPQYEYTHPLRRFVFRGSLRIRGEYADYQNDGTTPAGHRRFHLYASPDLYLHYQLNAQSAFRATLAYQCRYGDVLDMLTAPIQTDYLSRAVRSGVLSESRQLAAGLHYDFKIPLEMWFLNADARYSRTWSNLMNGQEVSPELITQTRLLIPNHADRLSASLELTKQIAPLRTKLSLQASYAWSRNVILQGGAVIPYYGQNVGLSPGLHARPWDFIELDYRGDFARTFSRYLDSRRSYAAQTHRIRLSLFPVKACEAALSSDITRQEITDGTYKVFALFDAGVHYSFRSFRIGVEVNNLLNQQAYAYTVFSGLDKFTYQYRLRGREYLVSFLFTR